MGYAKFYLQLSGAFQHFIFGGYVEDQITEKIALTIAAKKENAKIQVVLANCIFFAVTLNGRFLTYARQ